MFEKLIDGIDRRFQRRRIHREAEEDRLRHLKRERPLYLHRTTEYPPTKTDAPAIMFILIVVLPSLAGCFIYTELRSRAFYRTLNTAIETATQGYEIGGRMMPLCNTIIIYHIEEFRTKASNLGVKKIYYYDIDDCVWLIIPDRERGQAYVYRIAIKQVQILPPKYEWIETPQVENG